MPTKTQQEGGRLRIFLKHAKLKQKDFAELIGVTPPSITKYLSGEIPMHPNHATLLRKKYRMNLNWYYMGEGNMLEAVDKDNLVTNIKEIKVDLSALEARMKRLERRNDLLYKELEQLKSTTQTDTIRTH